MYKIFNLLLASLAVFALAGCGAGSTTPAVVSLTSFTLLPVNPVVDIQDTISLIPTGTYSNGTVKEIDLMNFTWSSDKESVARVNLDDRIIGVSAGTAKITATFKLNTNVKATTTLQVTAM